MRLRDEEEGRKKERVERVVADGEEDAKEEAYRRRGDEGERERRDRVHMRLELYTVYTLRRGICISILTV